MDFYELIANFLVKTEVKKQAAADVLFQYSKFVMACIGNQVRPCDLRMHLMKVNFVCLQVYFDQALLWLVPCQSFDH